MRSSLQDRSRGPLSLSSWTIQGVSAVILPPVGVSARGTISPMQSPGPNRSISLSWPLSELKVTDRTPLPTMKSDCRTMPDFTSMAAPSRAEFASRFVAIAARSLTGNPTNKPERSGIASGCTSRRCPNNFVVAGLIRRVCWAVPDGRRLRAHAEKSGRTARFAPPHRTLAVRGRKRPQNSVCVASSDATQTTG